MVISQNSTHDKEIEFKQCPFCGGKAEMKNKYPDDEPCSTYVVKCCMCRACATEFGVSYSGSGDAAENDAINAWNMRKGVNAGEIFGDELEFKKCPFCGGDAQMQYDLGIHTVQCTGCGAFSNTFDDWHVGEKAWQDAKNAWNQRAE